MSSKIIYKLESKRFFTIFFKKVFFFLLKSLKNCHLDTFIPFLQSKHLTSSLRKP